MEIRGTILERKDHGKWDAFVASHSLGNIHQTSRWGNFQAARGSGWGYWIIGLFDGENLCGGALLLRRALPAGRSWLYIAKGPLLAGGDGQSKNAAPEQQNAHTDEQLKALLGAIRQLAKGEKALFLRVEPAQVLQAPAGFGVREQPDWHKFGFRPAHAHYQPEHSLLVDLRRTEEQILAQMKPKGRYNIKVAQKKGVEVLVAGGEGGLSREEGVVEFHRLLRETTSRDGFAGHGRDYYLQMLEKLEGGDGEGLARLYLARSEGKFIAGIVVTHYRELAIYYFGASSDSDRNLMAPYLLQWEAMREAKKRGCLWYDFLGTAPLNGEAEDGFDYDPKHAWAGVTAFKLKFGGQKVNYAGGQELLLQPIAYGLLRIAKGLSALVKRVTKITKIG